MVIPSPSRARPVRTPDTAGFPAPGRRAPASRRDPLIRNAAAWLIAQCVVAGALVLRPSWWLPDPGPGHRTPWSRSGSASASVLHRITPLTPPALLCRLPDRLTTRRLARQLYPGARRLEIGSAQRTPGGLLVVRVSADADPPVAVKHPLTPRAVQTLADERRVVRALAEDERLANLRPLLASETACQLREPLPLVAETWLPGVAAGTALRRSPDALSRVVAGSLAAIGEVHSATGRPEPAAAHLRPWVDARVAVLSAEIGWCRRDAGADLLEALRRRLHEGLADRTMTVGWTHGDFTAGNILLADDLASVTGLIDWSTAGPDGPVDVDAYTLVLTLHHELTGRALGRIVADVVRTGRLPATSRGLPGGAAADDPDPTLALLTWLWHVANNTSKSPRYGLSTRWVAGNVVPVLKAMAP